MCDLLIYVETPRSMCASIAGTNSFIMLLARAVVVIGAICLIITVPVISAEPVDALDGELASESNIDANFARVHPIKDFVLPTVAEPHLVEYVMNETERAAHEADLARDDAKHRANELRSQSSDVNASMAAYERWWARMSQRFDHHDEQPHDSEERLQGHEPVTYSYELGRELTKEEIAAEQNTIRAEIADILTRTDVPSSNRTRRQSGCGIDRTAMNSFSYPTSAIVHIYFDLSASSTNGPYVCSGTLIGTFHVLTAAHCVYTHTWDGGSGWHVGTYVVPANLNLEYPYASASQSVSQRIQNLDKP